MDAPRVARSSLFHMRMELRHRDTYRARWQERWQEMAAEARARLEALDASRELRSAPTAAERLARWRRERPAMLNDTRKLMAAAFLLLAPPAADKRTAPACRAEAALTSAGCSAIAALVLSPARSIP